MLGHGSGAESGGNGEIEYLSLTGTALSSIITLAKEQSGGDADDGHVSFRALPPLLSQHASLCILYRDLDVYCLKRVVFEIRQCYGRS